MASATISLPGLDLTLLEAIRHNELHNAQRALFRYDNEDGTPPSEVTWAEAGESFTRAAHYILRHLKDIGCPVSTDSASPTVVGVLANLDSITFYSVCVGIMKAGLVPFLISTRNSPEAVAHLISSGGFKVLLISDDLVIKDLVSAAIRSLEANAWQERTQIQTIISPSFEQLYGKGDQTIDLDDNIVLPEIDTDANQKWDRICVSAHSSGTTSLPKPITHTQRLAQQHASMNRHDEKNYIGDTLAAHAVPMFHFMGFSLIGWSTFLGLTLSLFKPRKPPTVPAPGLVLQGAISTGANVMFCAPSFLEAWSTDPVNVEHLKSFKSIIYGGGPMREDVGELLVREGVKLSQILGLSETGCITPMLPTHIGPKISPDWLEAHPMLDVVFIPEDEEKLKGVYRIAVKVREFNEKARVLQTQVEGVPAYDTKDLVIFHPEHPTYFKLVGRADDQITHSTGEKTNPGPIEITLSKSPYISDALVFGRARLQAGVIIKPAPGYEFDIKDHKKFDAYLALIWDAITEANASSPQHSRIFKEMILVMDPTKPFEYTPKGTLRRALTLKQYKLDIDQLYEITEGSEVHPKDFGQPASLNFVDVASFIHDVVLKILNRDIKYDDDIFRAGADSLCALSIRVSIMQGLKGLVGRAKADTLPRDVVYMYPTISALAAFVSNPFLTIQLGAHDPDAEKLLKDDLQWENILTSHANKTVVKITPGNGEPPLILLHGGGGGVDPFRSFMNERSAVWAIQMTDDLPLDSTESICKYYYQKIKEQQPQGPYRLAGYSGSCLWVLELARLFENGGDKVTHIDILDHCPAAMFPNFDPSSVHIDSPEWMAEFLSQTVLSIANLLIPTIIDRPRFLSDTVLVRRYEDLKAALISEEIPPHLDRFVKFLKAMQETSIRYLMKANFLETDDDGVQSWSSELFRRFTAQLKAPITLYVATYGVNATLPPGTDIDKVRDLGASMVFDKYSVVSVPGDHLAFLDEEELHQHLLS